MKAHKNSYSGAHEAQVSTRLPLGKQLLPGIYRLKQCRRIDFSLFNILTFQRDSAERMADSSKTFDSKTPAEEDTVAESIPQAKSPRPITLYDAVAGRAGLNGFLTQEQRRSENILPLAPEGVLLNRTTIPKDLVSEAYDASEKLPNSTRLPESEMLKAIHTYAADFYSAAVKEEGKCDFRSLDETALIAVGILLEEAVREALGQNGDMVFVEPEGLENGLDETKLTKYQVKGKVKPTGLSQQNSDEDSLREDESPLKKQRR